MKAPLYSIHSVWTLSDVRGSIVASLISPKGAETGTTLRGRLWC
jgi:hypothetical protein